MYVQYNEENVFHSLLSLSDLSSLLLLPLIKPQQIGIKSFRSSLEPQGTHVSVIITKTGQLKMAAASNLLGNLPVLDGKNWDRWCVQMKVIFGYQEVTENVMEGFPDLGENPSEAQRAAHKESKKKDCKALFLLHQCVDPVHFLEDIRCEECQGGMGYVGGLLFWWRSSEEGEAANPAKTI